MSMHQIKRHLGHWQGTFLSVCSTQVQEASSKRLGEEERETTTSQVLALCFLTTRK